MNKAATRANPNRKSSVLALPLIASLLAAAGGWFVAGVLTPPQTPPSDAAVAPVQGAAAPAGNKPAEPATGAHGKSGAKKGEEQGEDTEPAATPIGEVVELPPIVVNLQSPSKVWARLEIAVVFTETPDVDARRQIHQDILAFMGTVTPAQLEGASGLSHLREDIVDIASVRSGGKARTVLFKTLIFE